MESDNAGKRVTVMGELWSESLGAIKDCIGKQNFDTWIKPVRFITKNKHEVTLEMPNKFFRDWLTENYIGQIEFAGGKPL